MHGSTFLALPTIFLYPFYSWRELAPSIRGRIPSSTEAVGRVLNEEVDIIVDYTDINSTAENTQSSSWPTAGIVFGAPGGTRSKSSKTMAIDICGLGIRHTR